MQRILKERMAPTLRPGSFEPVLGLLTDAGDYLKFSAEGDKKGVEWLTSTTRQQDLKVRVTGTLKGGLLHVVSITER